MFDDFKLTQVRRLEVFVQHIFHILADKEIISPEQLQEIIAEADEKSGYNETMREYKEYREREDESKGLDV